MQREQVHNVSDIKPATNLLEDHSARVAEPEMSVRGYTADRPHSDNWQDIGMIWDLDANVAPVGTLADSSEARSGKSDSSESRLDSHFVTPNGTLSF